MSNLAKERQIQRLQYIDLCAYTLGYINRKLLMNRFEIKEAWATKDFSAYQALSGDRLVYDHALRAYKPVDWFSPVFEHKVSEAILLSTGSQNIICDKHFSENSYSYAINNTEPELENIHNVLRALHLNKKVETEYISISSGKQTRLLAPHTLIQTGNFQYVRAFDHKTGEFRNFKLNRITGSKLTNFTAEKDQQKTCDTDWNSNVILKIGVNSALENKEAIEYDFGLIDGELTVEIKKALVKFFLMDWHVAPIEHQNLPATLFPLQLLSMSGL